MNNIKSIIQERGFTLSEVAARMGISQPALSKMLINGNITLSNINKIASAIGLTRAELLAEDNMICPHCGKPIHVNVS